MNFVLPADHYENRAIQLLVKNYPDRLEIRRVDIYFSKQKSVGLKQLKEFIQSKIGIFIE